METIGRYRILKELGRGAGGVVYLAEDPRIGRQVAVKTISVTAAGAAGETLRKRLQREARSAGSLAHPNIVTVFELDEEGPFTFVVMEFVEGETLRAEMAAGGKMPNEQILALLRQVAEGLDFAHARSVVHRDIKPANIMVTADRTVKIADFGVAKMLGDATMGLTQAGAAIGTPHYMSPEQVLGKPVTGQSDQFSLAVIAYELLTGSRPFEGDSITSIMYLIVNEDPALEGIQSAGLTSPVFEVLMRGLAKEPQDRYPTCSQLISDLTDAVLHNRAPAPASVPAAPPPAAPSLASDATPLPAPAPVIEPAAAPETPVSVPVATLAGSEKSNTKWLAVAAAVVLLLAGGIWFARRSGSHPETGSPGESTPAPVATTPAHPAPPVAETAAKAAPPVVENHPAPPVKKPEVKPEVKKEVERVAAEETANRPAEEKMGLHGTFTWSGLLAAGDSLEISDGQPASGSIGGHKPPPHASIKVLQVDPPDVSVDETPSADNGYTLRLINSGRDVSNFSVTWRMAKKGESADE